MKMKRSILEVSRHLSCRITVRTKLDESGGDLTRVVGLPVRMSV